jgi:hypothetical protein
MPKSQQEIEGQVQDLYQIVCTSAAPLNLLGMKTKSLVDTENWSKEDAERVYSGVLELLIKSHGWKRFRP